jgi:hypothetical protein
MWEGVRTRGRKEGRKERRKEGKLSGTRRGEGICSVDSGIGANVCVRGTCNGRG